MKAFVISMTAVVAFVWVSASRSDDSTTSTSAPTAGPVPEPITEQPIMPAPGSETPQRDHFVPYDPGPPEARWSYQQLNPAEKAHVDRGRNVDGWADTHAAFQAASTERIEEMSPQIAAAVLGADHLDEVGVVP